MGKAASPSAARTASTRSTASCAAAAGGRTSRGWQADIVLSHTTPLSLEPREAFLPFIDQRTVDTSTEEWLDGIERRLDYKRWYAGHFHTVKETGKLRLMYQDYAKLGE